MTVYQSLPELFEFASADPVCVERTVYQEAHYKEPITPHEWADAPQAPLVHKRCAHCGAPSIRLVRDNGKPYYCVDNSDCARARDRHRKTRERWAG